MIIKFSTKRDRNGNRYFLGFDTEKKVFARESSHWYGRDDIIEIGKNDRRELIEKLQADGYTEINYI